jgi:hypothetical protein
MTKIVHDNEVFNYSTTEKRLTSYFYITHVAEKEEVQNAIHTLVAIGLVKCVLRRGPSHWDVAYREGTSDEIVPTAFALRLMKKYVLRNYFMDKGLY